MNIDENHPLWLLIFPGLPLLIFFFLFRFMKKLKTETKAELAKVGIKKRELEEQQSSEPVFICYGADEIDTSLIQLHGTPYKTVLRPGMKVNVLGIEHPIKEVYANDNTPEKADLEIPENSEDVAIVIEFSGFDHKNFQQQLQAQGVLLLGLS